MVELVNPYDTSQPVSEKMFFGRDDVLAWVRENLIGSRRVFVLHGPRRIGKTSLLRHLIHHLPPGYVSIFLDLRNMGQKDLSGLLWQVAVEMVSMLREAHDLTLAEPALDDMQKDTSYLTDHFLPQVRESLSDRQLVLMADNLDALANTWGAELAHAFFSYLTNVLKDEPWIRLILALRHPRDFEGEHPRLFATAAYRKLGSLTSTEAARLIREPVSGMLGYDVGVARRITELTSNHPYFVQLLCYTLFNRCARSGRATLSDVDGVVDELLELGIPDFDELWEASSSQEKIVLATLGALRGGHGIATRQDASSALSRRGIRADQNEVAEALDSLVARDILERLGALSYRFNVDLLRIWLGRSKRPDEVYREIRWPTKAKPSESRRLARTQPNGVQPLTGPETHPWWVRWIIVMLAFAAVLLSALAVSSWLASRELIEGVPTPTSLTATAVSQRMRPTFTPTIAPTPTRPIVIARTIPAIAYMCKEKRADPWQICVMDSDGANVTVLTDSEGDDTTPTWSPDGEHIAFVSYRDGNREVYVMDPDGRNQVNLTNNPADDWMPSWSPDGKRIAFVSYRDGNWEIYAMGTDGSGVTRLTEDEADDWTPYWSPDAAEITFCSTRDGNWEIYVMDSNGSLPIRLTEHTENDIAPTWSPDGQWIAFESTRDGNSEIYVMDRNGEQLRNLSNESMADDHGPSWSPDGSRIVFYSIRDGDWDIYAMNDAGGEVINLTNNETNDQTPVWRP
ncbi:MAG: DPP IV N-terminal domain-containing protein [Anaerolineae bacterium]|nr:DPP IV N-terminal domain-containing protein [Anaerolineae bacterium]